MRRLLILLTLAVAGCQQESRGPGEAALYRGEGRDRLCLVPDGDGLRAGLIAYGAGDSNCSLGGGAEIDGQHLTISASGDPVCKVEASLSGGVIRFATLPYACAYYCAPGADLSGRSFRKQEQGDPAEARDLGGDRLC